MTNAIAAAGLALGLAVGVAHAQSDGLNQDIVSPVPEAQEDCEALERALRESHNDETLTRSDRRELRDKGC